MVVYPTEDTEAGLIDRVIALCQELIREKETFFQRYKIPEAIDIGISHGEAVIGMMGPDGFKKATALGSTPGRSRRLQAGGKLLRMKLGATDRIIFGADTLMSISKPFAVNEWKMEPRTRFRDIADDTVFYIEPLMTS